MQLGVSLGSLLGDKWSKKVNNSFHFYAYYLVSFIYLCFLIKSNQFNMKKTCKICDRLVPSIEDEFFVVQVVPLSFQ